jgi:hypothetical protein
VQADWGHICWVRRCRAGIRFQQIPRSRAQNLPTAGCNAVRSLRLPRAMLAQHSRHHVEHQQPPRAFVRVMQPSVFGRSNFQCDIRIESDRTRKQGGRAPFGCAHGDRLPLSCADSSKIVIQSSLSPNLAVKLPLPEPWPAAIDGSKRLFRHDLSLI